MVEVLRIVLILAVVAGFVYFDFNYIFLIVVLALLGLMFWSIPVAIAVSVLIALLLFKLLCEYWAYRDRQQYMQRQAVRATQVADAFARQHAQSLALRKQRLLARPGDTGPSDWKRELKRIIDTLTHTDAQLILSQTEMQDAIERVIGQTQVDPSSTVDAAMDSRMFGQHCAAELGKAGWTVEVMDSPPDAETATLVASKNGEAIAFTCLSSDAPVYQDAVREAFAARTRYGTQASAVVANTAFGAAAHRFRRTTGTILLHHTELCTYSSIKGG